jgi:hypothetical protein
VDARKPPAKREDERRDEQWPLEANAEAVGALGRFAADDDALAHAVMAKLSSVVAQPRKCASERRVREEPLRARAVSPVHLRESREASL